MSEYAAPLKDMQFVLRELVGIEQLLSLPGYADFDVEQLSAVLEQAATFAAEVLAPLNRVGDLQGARLENGEVVLPPGWAEAYRRYVADGWNGLASAPDWGGQGLPVLISAMTEEMWNSANMSFSLAPMLTHGATEALQIAASPELQQAYLPHMVRGGWMGTMNLTESQAGSDLAAVRCRAVPQADGTYRITGQKIFITYGDHTLAENIVHLVLARTPTAPAGVKGISLFLVPKFLLKDDGSVGARNDVRCVSLEHKLGIHASPTCVMAYGSQEQGDGAAAGALGWRVGEENRGLETMFIMMNAARFSVGVQGIGIAERAYQRARHYAQDRRQGADAAVRDGESVPIIRHPDVRRMLLTMKATTEAMRSLACVVAVATDLAQAAADSSARERARARAALLIPVVKGWCTESAVAVASLGVQVHGGMGFIEETGAAQHLRDARILPIYEGTTGIQAIDLVGRKILRDGGAAARDLSAEVAQTCADLEAATDPQLRAMALQMGPAIMALDTAVQYVLVNGRKDIRRALAGATPLLKLFGIVAGGWQLCRAALISAQRLTGGHGDDAFYRAKILTARFYADNILCEAASLAHAACAGSDAIVEYADDQV